MGLKHVEKGYLFSFHPQIFGIFFQVEWRADSIGQKPRHFQSPKLSFRVTMACGKDCQEEKNVQADWPFGNQL